MAEIVRPNGKVYRPRNPPVAVTLGNEDEITAVVVFGTHDPVVATPLALAECQAEFFASGLRYALAPEPTLVWLRGIPKDSGYGDTMIWYSDDPDRGRPGVHWVLDEVDEDEAEERPEGIMLPPLDGLGVTDV